MSIEEFKNFLDECDPAEREEMLELAGVMCRIIKGNRDKPADVTPESLASIALQQTGQAPLDQVTTATLRAKQWREDNGYTGKGGVITVYQGEVQGWTNELRHPERWQPGCLAITEDGDCYRACGGSNYGGAERWTSAIAH